MSAPQAVPSPQRERKRVNINNSLSTLSPINYEAMNTIAVPVQSGALGGKPLTVRDIILWHQEQAQHRGELGFTTNFPNPSDIFKQITIYPFSDHEPPADDRAALVAAMQENHKAIIQLHQRKTIMDAAGPLLAKSELDVNQTLLAAGVSEQELTNKSLGQKIVQLVEFEEPPPKENFVAIWVNVASTTKGRSHMLEVNLPLKACVAEVYALLDEIVKALLAEIGFSYEGGGTWKYQLINQSQSLVLMEKSLPLETDRDYESMLQKVSEANDATPPVAVLTQDGLASPLAMSGANAKAHNTIEAEGESTSDAIAVLDEFEDGVLDEDGKPYFEPLELDRLCKKYADFGDDLTSENGIHGFWR